MTKTEKITATVKNMSMASGNQDSHLYQVPIVTVIK